MIIKICGITDPQDARDAALLGADWVGFLLSRKSKRCVSVAQGREIAQAARESGVKPIAVFVDETGEEILDACTQVGIHTIQLHGKGSKQYIHLFLPLFELVFALGVSSEGIIVKEDIELVQSVGYGQKILPPWMLFDYLEGGSGRSFSWAKFHPPFRCPWILAGGVNPINVAEAISLLHPHGIDVSSGVEKPNSIRKDRFLIEQLITNTKSAYEKLKENENLR
jgi:phosphoribosylanthranilate isomerase